MNISNSVRIYDTTLRDGSQKKGISYSLEDKISIVKKLNAFGVHYIEGGWPGSNPKDKDFFDHVKNTSLSSKIVAFGSTRRKNVHVSNDDNLFMLVAANTPAVAIVGKSWTLHVTHVLETTLENNLEMIRDSVEFCKSRNREVIYDAEHFFDGYKADPVYAMKTIQAACSGGADWIVLCDTNGGTMPSDISRIVRAVKQECSVPVGIHAHNDCELAVANSLAAVEAGATQVQGTVNGYGERCGNANLISIIPNLQIKMGYPCIPHESLTSLVHLSHFVSEKANLAPDAFQAYVGSAAFAHKGGIHVAAVEKINHSYEHIDPKTIGNKREIVVSELSGRGNMRMLAEEWGVRNDKEADTGLLEEKALQVIKSNEQKGYQYEGAEGSVELIMRKMNSSYTAPFVVTDYVVVSEKRAHSNNLSMQEDSFDYLEAVQAIVKLQCNHEKVHTAADGDGPIHALDQALRKSLLPFYPFLSDIKLIDYKVRILDPHSTTSATTRVLIEASNGSRTWTTVGCGRNVISASFQALIDSFELAILRDREEHTEVVSFNL